MIWRKDYPSGRVACYYDKQMPARRYRPPSAALLNFYREERVLAEQSKLKKLTRK